MNTSTQIVDAIRNQGLLPLYFHKDSNTAINILQALFDAGVRVVEFTNRGDEALSNFRELVKTRDSKMPGLLLSAGTIKTRKDAEEYIDAGADFLISPGLNEEVGTVSNERNIFWVPGCMTPSEIMKAETLGATLVKIFPGNLLGPGFVQSIKELFPKLLFIPTGGVTLDTQNISSWFKSGVIAVGAGSTLINKQSVESGDFDSIRSGTAAALQLVQQSR